MFYTATFVINNMLQIIVQSTIVLLFIFKFFY